MNSQLVEIDEQKAARFRRLIIVGDLHGDYAAFHSLLGIASPTRDALLFLGDYADRGAFGLEIIEEIDRLSSNYPDNVFLLKGNHEDYTEDGEPNFLPSNLRSEVEKKKGDWQEFFRNEFSGFLAKLKIAAILKGEVLFVHGGVSGKIVDAKKLICPSREVEIDVIWSDPFDGFGERPNFKRGGVGVEFGVDITEQVCERLGVKRIIRSHEPGKATAGPAYTHRKKLLTISSTSMYGGFPFALSTDPAKPFLFRTIKLL